MNIVCTRRATRLRQAAYEHWARQRSLTAADKMLEHIFSVVELPENPPEMGRPRRVPGTGELGLVPMLFLVAFDRNSIEIVALLHRGRKRHGHV